MKYSYRYFYITLFILLAGSYTGVQAQGCIAIRNMSSCSAMVDTIGRGFQFSMNYRYFHSFRHFRGSHEETDRVTQHTNVINNDNSWVMGVSYATNTRWNFSVTIPYLYIDRSSLYEHMGNSGQRFHTQSQGLGDVRLVVNYDLLPTAHNMRLAVGLGAKLPTGNYNYKDYFHTGVDTLTLRAVDQSIQPGDGGWGIVSEFDASYFVSYRFHVYGNGVYMFNPRNTNGTTPRSSELSVADQYIFRAGGRYALEAIQFSLGGRIEGIPTHDAIGKSDGFRRPGYIFSADPAVAYHVGPHAFGINLPIAILRARTKNVSDLESGGKGGDAAFADYLISIGYSYRLAR